MARPIKQGIDYFSFDVDFFNDEKIQFVSARFGIKGEIVAIKLLCKIYRNGYYLKWGEDENLLFAKGAGDDVKPSLVSEIIGELVVRGFFDKTLLNSFNILTSAGIQKRFLEAVQKRKNVKLIKEFLLIRINDYINSDKVVIKSINSAINTQSKVKESKF